MFGLPLIFRDGAYANSISDMLLGNQALLHGNAPNGHVNFKCQVDPEATS